MIIDRGHGTPLVVIPGLQGRWEYMRRAVDALAAHCRVVTFSLCDEPSSGRTPDSYRGIDSYVDQIEAVLDELRLPAAAICGVSLGGLIALRFAARHPERTSALILISTPGPDLTLRPSSQLYMRFPRILSPLFFAGAPRRLRPEIARALPSRRARLRFNWDQLKTLVRAPLSPTRMARRARMIGDATIVADCARVSAPTLVLTGEPELDRVVRPASSAAYVDLISGARAIVFDRTGHLGYITRPSEFAAIISTFLEGRARSGDHSIDRSHHAVA